MTPMDLFLSDAGWLFFSLWGTILVAVSVIAFGRDLFPFKARSDSSTKDSRRRNG